MRKQNVKLRPALLLALLLACYSGSGMAELADRDKPINLEADTVTVDDVRQESIYIGNVTLSQGTLVIRGDKLIVKQNAGVFEYGIAYGNPASFRQKREGFDEYIEGYGLRIEYDGTRDFLQLFDQARMKCNQDEVRGNYISYNAKTEFYQVIGGKQAGNGKKERVHAVILPKKKPAAPPAPGTVKTEPQ